MAQTLLTAKGLSKSFWAEAGSTTVYLINVTPTAAMTGRTPQEEWYGSKPNVNYL